MEISTGAPHFRGLLQQYRSTEHTINTIINEAVDNIIKKATQIQIKTEVNDENGLIKSISISDNYSGGFENINNKGCNNPFNMSHMREGQKLDNETSEFGVGLKAGALTAGDKLTVYTRVNNKYYKVIMDFIKMKNEADVMKSYNPQVYEYDNNQEYKDFHPYEYGSTIIFSEIREIIHHKTTNNELTKYIIDNISLTYAIFIKNNVKILVNDKIVHPQESFFDDPKSSPFTIKKLLYVLSHKRDRNLRYVVKTIREKNKDVQKNSEIIIDNQNSTFKISSVNVDVQELLNKGWEFDGSISQTEKAAMLIETTFTKFSDKFKNNIESNLMPKDKIEIYKDNRLYGNYPFSIRNNGVHNYTFHRLQFISKDIGKKMGITYNKRINDQVNNDLTNIVKYIIGENRKYFSADSNTILFKKLEKEAIEWKILPTPPSPPVKPTPPSPPVKPTPPSPKVKPTPPVVSEDDTSEDDTSEDDTSEDDRSEDDRSEDDRSEDDRSDDDTDNLTKDEIITSLTKTYTSNKNRVELDKLLNSILTHVPFDVKFITVKKIISLSDHKYPLETAISKKINKLLK